ncbi:NAD(P)-dependent oxidoreductase [Nocardiopsis composta]
MDETAFIGLGRMGLPMARRLLAADLPLTVWNRTRAKAEPLAAMGARIADSPAEAVRGAATVVTMVSDPAALREVADAALPGLPPDAVWLEMSSVGPEAVAELAGRLPAGAALIDAPVLGSVDRAAEGGCASWPAAKPPRSTACWHTWARSPAAARWARAPRSNWW